MGQIFDDRLFKPPGTFMDLDYGHDLTDRKAAVLGIPYDNGAHPHRIGSRDGPRAIREASRLIRRYRLSDVRQQHPRNARRTCRPRIEKYGKPGAQ